MSESAQAGFFYMKEGHYYRQLGLSSRSGARCFIPDGHKDGPTINAVWDRGINGLASRVNWILLSLSFETFGTEFTVGFIPDGKEKYSDQVFVWGVDVCDKTPEQVIATIRDLVNAKLVA